MAEPRDAQTTVIGGGAVGAAALYFLAREGWSDVQLIEKGDLCAATSSQAAGFVGQARPQLDRAKLTIAATQLYRTFEATTGYSMDFRECGAIRIALSEESEAELLQIEATAQQSGLPVEFVDKKRLQELCPVLDDVSAVRASLWSPTDGYVQPNSMVSAYASAARDLGATISTHTPVTAIGVEQGAVVSVTTPSGTVRTEHVVIAAGPWSAAVARLAGLDLPLVPVLHEYVVTEPLAGWDASLPMLRVPEIQVYARGESGRALCGGFEHQGTSIDPRSVAIDSALLARPNWDVLGGFVESLATLTPPLLEAGVSATFQGWPVFTPDGRFVVGPFSGIRGLTFAAGCNAHGVSGSAGLAMHLVESLGPDPSPYVRSLSPDRFVAGSWDWADARTRAQAVYENYYPMPGAAAVPH